MLMRIYSLRAVNGALLPIGTLDGLSLTLYENGTYASATSYTDTAPVPDVGRFTETARTLTLSGDLVGTGVILPELIILSVAENTYTLVRATA